MTADDSFENLLSDAEDCLANVEECLGGIENIDDLDPDTLETVQGDIDTLAEVTTKTSDLIETLDLSKLPEAVDTDELLAAIETGEIPAALSDEETGAGDVVEFTQLFKAIDLLNAWDATELTDIWQAKRELDDTLEAAADESDDASMVEDAASAVADDDRDLIGGEDSAIGGEDSAIGGEDGLMGGEDGLLGGDDEMLDDIDAVAGAKEALGKPDPAEDPEAYQVFIQEQAMRGIDAFRDALLETNAKFERLYEFNREKMRREDTSANSRNPTAASTIVTDRRDLGGGARHSTVPQQVKLSTAPSRKRIYGRRFEIERQKRKETNDD